MVRMASSATLSYRLLGLGLGLVISRVLTLAATLTMVAPGYGYGIVAMAALGYGGPQSAETCNCKIAASLLIERKRFCLI